MGETDDRTLNDIEPSKQLERPPPSVRQRLSTHRVPPPSYVPPDPVIIGPPDSEDAGPGLGTHLRPRHPPTRWSRSPTGRRRRCQSSHNHQRSQGSLRKSELIKRPVSANRLPYHNGQPPRLLGSVTSRRSEARTIRSRDRHPFECRTVGTPRHGRVCKRHTLIPESGAFPASPGGSSRRARCLGATAALSDTDSRVTSLPRGCRRLRARSSR